MMKALIFVIGFFTGLVSIIGLAIRVPAVQEAATDYAVKKITTVLFDT